jgi:hypothetical protein
MTKTSLRRLCERRGKTKIYSDTKGIPTIGIGYALIVKIGARYTVRSTLQSDFTGIHVFSTAELTLLDDIVEKLNEGKINQAKKFEREMRWRAAK